MQRTEASQTTRLQLVLAWSFAGIPLLAGVAQLRALLRGE